MKKRKIVICLLIICFIGVCSSILNGKNKSNDDINNGINDKILMMYNESNIENTVSSNNIISNVEQNSNDTISNNKKEITDWRLVLVNYENILPNNFEVNLSVIDEKKKFDARAIDDLREMMNDIKKEGILDIWIQSAYRSVSYQEDLFNSKVSKYMKSGKTIEEAERLTLRTINKAGTSEHNLGLAIDFNYVDYNFENSKGFKWLKENAEDYGFILRYSKEKENITKVDYEPWHWRYVGKEHAIKINELDMCLEEYINYLSNEI